MGPGVFKRAGSLTEIEWNNKMTEIPDETFFACDRLIKLPKNIEKVTKIGKSAFELCANFVGLNEDDAITIPNSVTEIGESAFAMTFNMKKITLSSSMTAIPKSAFSLSGLTDIIFPDSIKTIDSEAFYRSYIKKINLGKVETIGAKAFWQMQLAEEIVIPGTVKSIGDTAFGNPLKLKKVTLGSGLQEIGPSAFYDATLLGTVTIPSSVTKIGARAFFNCVSMSTMTIPSSVIDLGDNAFQYCQGLDKFRFESDSIQLGMGIIDGTPLQLDQIEYKKTMKASYANKAGAKIMIRCKDNTCGCGAGYGDNMKADSNFILVRNAPLDIPVRSILRRRSAYRVAWALTLMRKLP